MIFYFSSENSKFGVQAGGSLLYSLTNAKIRSYLAIANSYTFMCICVLYSENQYHRPTYIFTKQWYTGHVHLFKFNSYTGRATLLFCGHCTIAKLTNFIATAVPRQCCHFENHKSWEQNFV